MRSSRAHVRTCSCSLNHNMIFSRLPCFKKTEPIWKLQFFFLLVRLEKRPFTPRTGALKKVLFQPNANEPEGEVWPWFWFQINRLSGGHQGRDFHIIAHLHRILTLTELIVRGSHNYGRMEENILFVFFHLDRGGGRMSRRVLQKVRGTA